MTDRTQIPIMLWMYRIQGFCKTSALQMEQEMNRIHLVNKQMLTDSHAVNCRVSETKWTVCYVLLSVQQFIIAH